MISEAWRVAEGNVDGSSGSPAVRQRNTLYNGLFQVPTFQEMLDLRSRLSRELDRTIGVYPETKQHPTYFRALGLPLEEPLVAVLRRNGLDSAKAAVFVQSFEAVNLRDLVQKFRLRVAKVFLTAAAGRPFNDPRTYADYLTPAGLAELATLVDGISRSARRTSFCWRTCGSPPIRTRTGRRSTNRSPSWVGASTGSSPTRPTSACSPGRCAPRSDGPGKGIAGRARS
jgi:hypothetical protein